MGQEADWKPWSKYKVKCLSGLQGIVLKIGELASATGTPVESIRFYEREGLLPAPERAANNYRSYGPEHEARLAFIRHCRSLDMALDEIRVLLRFKDAPPQDCSAVNALLDEHISHVTDRICELTELKKELTQLRRQCGDGSSSDACGILEGLARAATRNVGPPAPRGHIEGSHGRARK